MCCHIHHQFQAIKGTCFVWNHQITLGSMLGFPWFGELSLPSHFTDASLKDFSHQDVVFWVIFQQHFDWKSGVHIFWSIPIYMPYGIRSPQILPRTWTMAFEVGLGASREGEDRLSCLQLRGSANASRCSIVSRHFVRFMIFPSLLLLTSVMQEIMPKGNISTINSVTCRTVTPAYFHHCDVGS